MYKYCKKSKNIKIFFVLFFATIEPNRPCMFCQKSSFLLIRRKQGEEDIKCLNKENGQSKPKFLGKEIGNFNNED